MPVLKVRAKDLEELAGAELRRLFPPQVVEVVRHGSGGAEPGQIFSVIGPNGAGKTTLFNLLTGVYPPSAGTIGFRRDGATRQLGGRRPYAICRAGVGRTFQNIRLFRNLPVLSNVMIALQQNLRYGLAASFLHTPGHRRAEVTIREQSMELLRVMQLDGKADEISANLSYGEQRRLEIARAMATRPVLLLLDEPAAGMNPAETAQLTRRYARRQE